MPAKSKLRGHQIAYIDGDWIYEDTGEPTITTHKSRPCSYCGEHVTPEGHDSCLGTLPGLMNACCGHGDDSQAYVQFMDGYRIGGIGAVKIISELKKHAKPITKKAPS